MMHLQKIASQDDNSDDLDRLVDNTTLAEIASQDQEASNEVEAPAPLQIEGPTV